MAVHTASTLVVQYKPYLELEFGYHSETFIATGFGSKSKSALFNMHYYFVGSFFVVAASPVMTRSSVLLWC